MNKYMLKKIVLPLMLMFFSIISSAQVGLNFQGVARANNNLIIATQLIKIKLSILQGSSNGIMEYNEVRSVMTNTQGLFSVVIGDTGSISTFGNFNLINWKQAPKFLKIEMDPAGGDNFITMGTTQFQYVAYAKFASSVEAENIIGIVPVKSGGTGTTNLIDFKKALVLDKLNNTSDLEKPVSSLVQAAIDLKEDVLNKSSDINLGGINSSDILYPSQKAVKSFVIATNTASITAEITRATNAEAALDTRITSNTASITTNAANILLRAPIASPSLTGTPTAPTPAPGNSSTQIATTDFVAALVNGSSAPDATATTKGILKLTNDLGGTAILPTVNSVGGVSSSTIATLPTLIASNTASITAEIARATNAEAALDTRITSNTASITTNAANILLRAPIASPSLTGTPTAPTPAPGNSSTQIATTDFVAALVNGSSAPDATATTKGILKLTNDLGGTAILPTVNSVGGVSSSTIATLPTLIASNTASITAEITRATNAEAALDTRVVANTASITGLLNTTLTYASITGPIPIWNQNTTGNAATATLAGTASSSTKLTTARNINGVPFDGSIDITVTADAGTLTGSTLKSTVTNSSLTSVGTLTSLEVNGRATNANAYNAGSSTTIDFTKSNLAYTSNSPGAFTLSGIKDGGTFTLAVQGTTAGTSTFTSNGFTFLSVNNVVSTSGKQTLYTFIVMGTTAYYFMTVGF